MSKRTIFWLLKVGELTGLAVVLCLCYWLDLWTGGSPTAAWWVHIFRGAILLSLFVGIVAVVGGVVFFAIPSWWEANKTWAERIYNRRTKK